MFSSLSKNHNPSGHIFISDQREYARKKIADKHLPLVLTYRTLFEMNIKLSNYFWVLRQK